MPLSPLVFMYKLTFASLLIFMSNCNLDGSKTFISNKISVVDKISNVEVEKRSSDTSSSDSSSDDGKTDDKPVDPPVIKSIRVETYGIDYGAPKQ